MTLHRVSFPDGSLGMLCDPSKSLSLFLSFPVLSPHILHSSLAVYSSVFTSQVS